MREFFILVTVVSLIAAIVLGIVTSGASQAQRTEQLRLEARMAQYEAMQARERTLAQGQVLAFLLAGVVIAILGIGGFSLVGFAYVAAMTFLAHRSHNQPKVVERIVQRNYLVLPPDGMARRELWQLASRNGYEPIAIEAKSNTRESVG